MIELDGEANSARGHNWRSEKSIHDRLMCWINVAENKTHAWKNCMESDSMVVVWSSSFKIEKTPLVGSLHFDDHQKRKFLSMESRRECRMTRGNEGEEEEEKTKKIREEKKKKTEQDEAQERKNAQWSNERGKTRKGEKRQADTLNWKDVVSLN